MQLDLQEVLKEHKQSILKPVEQSIREALVQKRKEHRILWSVRVPL